MTLADDLKAVIYPIRAIPGQLGLRPHTVAIVTSFAGGYHTGEVDLKDSVPLTEYGGQSPKCAWLTPAQLAMSGLPNGSVSIGPITPDFGTDGGTLLSRFDGHSLGTGDTIHLLITGPKHPQGAYYKVSGIRADKALHYSLQATPVSSNAE